jgi:hypothetical protein
MTWKCSNPRGPRSSRRGANRSRSTRPGLRPRTEAGCSRLPPAARRLGEHPGRRRGGHLGACRGNGVGRVTSAAGQAPRRRRCASIAEERQRRRWPRAARNPKGAGGLRPHAASLVVADGSASPSSSLLACNPQAPCARPSRFPRQAPRRLEDRGPSPRRRWKGRAARLSVTRLAARAARAPRGRGGLPGRGRRRPPPAHGTPHALACLRRARRLRARRTPRQARRPRTDGPACRRGRGRWLPPVGANSARPCTRRSGARSGRAPAGAGFAR